MGSAESKSYEDKEEQYLQKLENEAIRNVLPRGLLDEKGNQLKYDLHYCLTRNDWWFTIGGVIAGSFLSWYYRRMQPIAAAAILAPGLDWAYSQTICSEYQEAYKNHKRKLLEEHKKSVEEIKLKVRQDFTFDSTNEISR
ncbi:hypothetical protein CEUSTIGMA_g11470.t1 [Chlamydomonas eustigma]|uniref:Uncharacterized protein n=1 Tax=Chlamydomonas eustigma TaxID=1157962 RepID=A0A250XLY6_9CHLO|nr:hypothetical protein CEUSTIGMA_g11470.t1 [Chlamydomonas eustigma]|eukprot:GAX84046.1 hypothetical protein CEUSTIGMA_g11470.t1 [Chlamydomonas eustigma]